MSLVVLIRSISRLQFLHVGQCSVCIWWRRKEEVFNMAGALCYIKMAKLISVVVYWHCSSLYRHRARERLSICSSNNHTQKDLDLCQLTQALHSKRQWSLFYDCIEMIVRGLHNSCDWWLKHSAIVPWGKLVMELDNNRFWRIYNSFLPFFPFVIA